MSGDLATDPAWLPVASQIRLPSRNTGKNSCQVDIANLDAPLNAAFLGHLERDRGAPASASVGSRRSGPCLRRQRRATPTPRTSWRRLPATESDPVDANEAPNVGGRRPVLLDSSSSGFLECSAKLSVALCRPLMAPRLAPQSGIVVTAFGDCRNLFNCRPRTRARLEPSGNLLR